MLKMIGQNKLILMTEQQIQVVIIAPNLLLMKVILCFGKIGYLINEKNFINVAVGLTDLRVKR